MASVTGPHSTGSVSTCMARGREVSSCSGRVIRSHQRDTGRKHSVTPMVASLKSSICCSTGSGPRLANTSPGRNSTGSRLTCATPAAVSMFMQPGPIDVVQAIICRRFLALANATAASAIPCSLCAR